MSDVRESKDKDKPGGPDKPKPDNKFDVTVEYNGVGQTIEVKRKDLVQSLLEEAVRQFGLPAGRFRLLNGSNEVPPQQTVEQAGLQEGARLTLAPVIVRGG